MERPSNKSKIPLDGSIYLSAGFLADDTCPDDIYEQIEKLAILAESKKLKIRLTTTNDIGKRLDSKLSNKEIVLPWDDFYNAKCDYKTSNHAKLIAMRFQPNLSTLKPAIHAIVGHYVQLVLGQNLIAPIRCMVCWTPDGCETLNKRTVKTGRIGIAIAVASWINVPIFNLKNSNAYTRAENYISTYAQPFTEGEFHPDIVSFNRMKEL
jgi:hypothetical protein